MNTFYLKYFLYTIRIQLANMSQLHNKNSYTEPHQRLMWNKDKLLNKITPTTCCVLIGQKLHYQFSLQGVGRLFVCGLPRASQQTVVCVTAWPHFTFLCIVSLALRQTFLHSVTHKSTITCLSMPSLCFQVNLKFGALKITETGLLAMWEGSEKEDVSG